MMHRHYRARQGFTLVELAIVLVIIGLIIGGVLVGQNLIEAATLHAQVDQITRLNAGANTFRVKYNHLPGDIPDPAASSFGFVARGPYAGQGDGNGVIQGNIYDDPAILPSMGFQQLFGETATFWEDLSQAGLIPGKFSTAVSVGFGGTMVDTMPLYFPTASIRDNSYVYVYSEYGVNYFGVGAFAESDGFIHVGPSMTVAQAENIDTKIDDGKPEYGTVRAQGIEGSILQWADGAGFNNNATWTAIAPSATTCFDNNNTGNPHVYSVGYEDGANLNCALTFRFQ